MAIIYMKRVNAAFLQSYANSDRSFDTVTLKESDTEYASGEVVVAEYVANVATGKYVAAASVPALADYDVIKAGFLIRRTDASEGDVQELIVNTDAEVRARDTTLADLSVASRAAVLAAVEAAGIKVR